MDDKQINYLNMATAAVEVLDQNHNIWLNNTKFSNNVTAIKDIIQYILTTLGIQQKSAKGATVTQYKEWSLAADLAYHLCVGLKTYYMDTDDLTNYGIVNYTMSDLIYCGRVDAIDRMNRINAKAGTIAIADLVEYNIVATDITESIAATAAFEDAVPGHRVIQAETVAATDELPGLFRDLRKKFVLQDLFVGTYQKSRPTFFDTYMAARKIVNYGKTQQAEEVELMPNDFKAIFGKKFEPGYWITVRNNCDFPAKIMLSDTPDELKLENEVTVDGNMDMKFEIPKDFNCAFKHWIMVANANPLDVINVTVILSKGKSQSDAKEATGKISS